MVQRDGRHRAGPRARLRFRAAEHDRLRHLPAALRADGTAPWTLIRPIDSSIGISIVIAELTSKTWAFHSQPVEFVTSFNPALADPDTAGILDTATDTSRARLDQTVTREAAIMADQNDHRLMMGNSLSAVPLLLALTSPKKAGDRIRPPRPRTS